MGDTSTAGRIDEPTFKVIRHPSIKSLVDSVKGITVSLFGLAILTATIRTVYRVQTHGRLMLDDLMLIFACVTLTAANGILFSVIPTLYWDEDLILNPNSLAIETAGSATAFVAQAVRLQRMVFSFVTLTWTSIFAVKICFLLFFLQIIDRLKKLMFIWKIVFCITVLVWCFCAGGVFISCPHFSAAACKSMRFPKTN